MIYVITFPSIYHAFRAKKVLKEQGVPSELIKIPRELSESCEGLAAKIEPEHIDQAVALLGSKGVAMVQMGVKIKE